MSANLERKERVGINASFGNASKNNDTLDVSNVNDETRHNIPDEVSELSAPEIHFDRQSHTHHTIRITISILDTSPFTSDICEPPFSYQSATDLDNESLSSF